MPVMGIRVLLVDNQQLFTEALRTLLELEEDIEVVGEAYDGLSGLDRVKTTKPDVAVVDLRMPGLNGIELCERVKAEHGGVRVVILTATEDTEFLTRAVEVGVDGYITKDCAMRELASCIRDVQSGRTVVPSSQLRDLIDNLRDRRTRDESPGEHMASFLTPREREVLELLVAGKSNDAIASDLFISQNTVRTHVQNLMSKLSVHSKLEAVAFAVRHNIVAVDRETR